jgi:hypothetical protein
MPRYVVERQFLVPMFEHIFVEAPNLEEACRRAVDDYAEPWGEEGAKIDYDNARPTTIEQAVEIPEELFPELRSRGDADNYDLSLVLYDSGLDLLPIPEEFADALQEPGDEVGFS